jgi:predicted transcriptional regulator
MSNKTAGTRQSIESLQARFQDLNKLKIQVETQRDHALSQLDELKAQAKEQYGSDDVEQLKKVLAEMNPSNEKKRSQYQASLDAIDVDLDAISEKFSDEEVE